MPRTKRLDIESADGTLLAVWVVGDGPPLVVVHGSLQDHSSNSALIDELAADFAVHALDRRGFGGSGETDPWSIEREFEDVAAVVDHVARATGAPVALWGHSFGASCAMGGATLTGNVSHLVLYEPSLGLRYPAGSLSRIEEALSRGAPEEAALEILSGVLELSARQVDELKETPRWATIIRSAHTISREARAEQTWSYANRFPAIAAPVLMLTGSDSPVDIKQAHQAAAAALGQPQVCVLEGHGHLAHRTDAPLVARATKAFVMA